MEEWMRQPVTQLKRLVKSRAGRIAELQMEIKILEGIIEKKVGEGDLGGASPEKPSPKPDKPRKEDSPSGKRNGQPASHEEQPEQSKIKEKSSTHAFQEID